MVEKAPGSSNPFQMLREEDEGETDQNEKKEEEIKLITNGSMEINRGGCNGRR